MTAEQIEPDGPNYDKQIGRAVKLALWDADIKQETLAYKLGMHTGSLSLSMNGKRPWRAMEVVMAASILGIDTATLLPHLDSNQEPSD